MKDIFENLFSLIIIEDLTAIMDENPYFVKMEKINSEINVMEKYIYLHIAMKSLIFWHKSLQIAGHK